MRTTFRYCLGLYLASLVGSILALVSTSLTPELQACQATGNYVLESVPLTVCSNVDQYDCNCDDALGGSIFSGVTSRLQARVAGVEEAGQPADPNGGIVPCNKAVTCALVDWPDLTCISGICGPPVNAVFGCPKFEPNIPSAWQSLTQASTCD